MWTDAISIYFLFLDKVHLLVILCVCVCVCVCVLNSILIRFLIADVGTTIALALGGIGSIRSVLPIPVIGRINGVEGTPGECPKGGIRGRIVIIPQTIIPGRHDGIGRRQQYFRRRDTHRRHTIQQ